MAIPKSRAHHRPRELRRRVALPARLRTGTQWGDICILNISSRGLMIQSARPVAGGSLVELHRGDHAIAARVVWQSGSRAGLRAEDRIPVEEIMSLGQSQALQLVVSDGARVERRKLARHDPIDARLRGRMLEFFGLVAIAASLALSAAAIAAQSFAKPLSRIEATLGG